MYSMALWKYIFPESDGTEFDASVLQAFKNLIPKNLRQVGVAGAAGVAGGLATLADNRIVVALAVGGAVFLTAKDLCIYPSSYNMFKGIRFHHEKDFSAVENQQPGDDDRG